MTSFYDNYHYYKKMLELQEKLRKSEEERIRLEERFKILVQESRNRHDACINRLRLRYIEFLEEQRSRDERNHKLLEALDKVDNSLALMSEKTDRLNVLRKQYEAYLRRIYTVPSPSRSITDENNIAGQSGEKYPRKDIIAEQIHFPSKIENISSSQILRLNGQKTRSVSPSASKLTKSAQNVYQDHCQQNIVLPKTLNPQINNQYNLRSYPSISQNSELIQQLPAQNLSLQSFQQRQPVPQIDPNLHIPYVSSGRSSSLSQRTISHFNTNKPLSERMEIAKTLSHFVIPERTNSSMLQYKFLDESQNRFVPAGLHYVHSSAVPSFRQENDNILLNDTQTQTGSIEEISPVYRTMQIPTERNICVPLLNKSLNLSKQASPSSFDYSWKKSDYFRSKQRSVNDTPMRPLTTSDVDDIIRRHRRFTPKTSTSTGLSMHLKQPVVEEDECTTTTKVENELDRYIDKIRKLHRDLDEQSLEEIDQEQNTSGNVLNVSLSDDNLEFPTEDRSKENLPKEVEKVLAIADDLASRTVDLNVANDSGKERVDENRNVELVQTTQSSTPISERNCDAYSYMHNRRETLTALAKDEISSDIKLHEPKLDPHQNIEKSRKENLSNLDNTLEQCKVQLPKMQEVEPVDFIVSSNDNITERETKNIISKNVQRGERNENDGICIATESNFDQYSFGVIEDLEPWSLDLLKRGIKEIDLTHESENYINEKGFDIDAFQLNQDNIEQTESLDKVETIENTHKEHIVLDSTRNELEQEKTECLESKEEVSNKDGTEISETSAVQHQEIEYKGKSYTNNEDVIQSTESSENQIVEQNEFNNEQKQASDETNFVSDMNQNIEQGIMMQNDEYSNQGYYEDPNQAQNYSQNYETEYAGLNEEYYNQNAPYENNQNQNITYEANQEQNYNSNASYETDQDKNYDPNASYDTNQDQNYDPNVVYGDNQNQEYQEYINQEYAQESNEQYGEYVGEQYSSENQYEHDPNLQYQEDSNQQYAYTYNQQYDTNQVTDTQENEPFAYSDYNPNQTELVQEDKQNQGYKESQEESKTQQVEEKVEIVQSKNEKLPPESEVKKKKDVIKSLLDSDTDSTIERNVSNTESDYDFN